MTYFPGTHRRPPGGSMDQMGNGSSVVSEEVEPGERLVLGFHGVRYQVRDVARAVEFYTKELGFNLEHQQLPAFGTVSIDGVNLLLSGPGASGSRPMPDSRQQAPG